MSAVPFARPRAIDYGAARELHYRYVWHAVERALEAEIGCADVLMLVASLRGAVHGLSAKVMEDHIRNHVVNPDTDRDPERANGAAELIEVVRTYLK